MNFFEKYYVGFQNERYKSTDTQRILGFATPIEENKAYEKRKHSVDRWSDNKIQKIIIDNKPSQGFKIVDTVSRYSTSNKLFRVFDPRGFELEISAENLFDIISKHTIVKGVIAESMLWGRVNGYNYLISANSEEYQKYLTDKDSPKKAIEAGSYFKNSVGNILYRFEGIFYFNTVEVKFEYDHRGRKMEWLLGGYTPSTLNIKFIANKRKNQKVFVYSIWNIDEYGYTYDNRKRINVRKTHYKDLTEVEKSSVKDDRIINYEFPINTFINSDEKVYIYSTLNHPHLTKWIFFKNKEDFLKMNYDNLCSIFKESELGLRSDIKANSKISYEYIINQ